MLQPHLLIYLMKVIEFMYAVKGHVGEECLCHCYFGCVDLSDLARILQNVSIHTQLFCCILDFVISFNR